MKLSIIMPVYNEKDTFAQILSKVYSVNIANLQKEIIIVDDCSTDGTREKLAKLKKKDVKVVVHKKNQGKGGAIKTGLKHDTGDIVIFQDADLEYDPNDYAKRVKPI